MKSENILAIVCTIFIIVMVSLLTAQTALGAYGDDQVGYFKLEEASTPYSNEVPGGNDINGINTPTRSSGIIDYGQRVDSGTSEYLQYPVVSSMSYSVSAWMNFTSGTDLSFNSWDNGQAWAFANIGWYGAFTSFPTKSINFVVVETDNTWTICSFNLNNYDIFTHLVFTWNTSNNYVDIYVDGVLDTHCAIGSTPKNIEKYVNYGTSSAFNSGHIDEFAVWNRTLTQADVTYLYDGGAPGSAQQYPYSSGPTIPTMVQINCTSPSPDVVDLQDGNVCYTNDATPTYSMITSVACDMTINGNTTCGTTGTTSHICTQPVAFPEDYANVTLQCNASGELGNFTYMNYIDTIAPNVTLNSPSSQNIYDENTVSINVTSWDRTDVNNITRYVDSVLNLTNSTPVNNTPWVDTLTIGTFKNYSIYFKSWDNISTFNEGTSSTIWLNFVDNPPSVTFNSPQSQSYVAALASITLNATAIDNVSLTNLTLYVDSVVNQTNNTPINNTPWVFNFTPSSFSNYSMYFRACDTSGNCSDSETRWFSFEDPFNFTLNGYARNITAELGSNVTAMINDSIGTWCFDINHPDYGTNVTCGSDPNLEIDISYFRKDELRNYDFEPWCYQEFANVSTICGGLNTGDYLASDITEYDSRVSGVEIEDTIIGFTNGVWSDYCWAGQFTPRELYINYTVPVDASNESLWLVSGANSDASIYTVNLTINQSCWNSSLLQFRVESNLTISIFTRSVFWQCYNGTSWLDMYGRYNGQWIHRTYGDAMWWYLNANTSNTKINFTFNGTNTATWYVNSHQYDEVINFTFNLTALEYSGSFPSEIKIYVNDTLSNDIGNVVNTLTTFNTVGSITNVTYTGEESQTVGYFRLPKITTITGAKFNVTGFNHTYYQADAENISYSSGTSDSANLFVYYEIRNKTFQSWDVKHGLRSRENISVDASCLNYGDWLTLEITSTWSNPNGITQPKCYDGSWNNVGTASSGSDSGSRGLDYGGSQGRMTDDNYATAAYWGQQPSYWSYWYAELTNTLYGNIFEEGIWWESPPRNPWIKVGILNGTYDWNQTSLYNTEERTDDFTASLTAYLAACTADDDGLCLVPVTAFSDIGGILEISGIEINYSVEVLNPIVIDSDVLQDFLDNSDGPVNIPIVMSSASNGIMQVDDIKFDYRGGNETYEVLAHNTDYTSNSSLDITYYYSGWTWDFPKNVDYMEFIPVEGPTQKNVTPYGQTSTRPILNFTSEAYGGKNFNFTVLINESFGCVNDSISLINSKSAGPQLIGGSWVNFTVNVTYEETFDMFSWADFQCNYSTWYLWEPYWYMRACCTGCDLCDDSVYNVVEM